MHALHLGIDIGGTFTDLVLFDPHAGRCHSCKELTTHDDPSRGVLLGVDKLFGIAGASAGAVTRVVHATTLFTNALLERRGAMTGLITTQGFADVLQIGNERRYELFDLHIRRPEPLVPRDRRREAIERIDARGNVLTALDVDSLLAAAQALVADGVQSLAIAFLNAYLNPLHELQAAAAIRRAFPGLVISTSHEVAPVVREDERISTTVANAYVKPLASTYLDCLVNGLQGRGVGAPMLLMLSDGGLTARASVVEVPIKAVESGPAAGVIAATAFGAEVGQTELIAFDMGGTTAKLCLVSGGTPTRSKMFEAARTKRFMRGSGLPIATPTVELIEIGAGGGSVAGVSAMGLLKVGPESAGSAPGPACFGLGGTEPTVTDANFVLGYLDPATFAGGTLDIRPELGRDAIQRLADRLGLGLERTAWGIVDVVNETMARAASVHIAEHGRDPRQFVLAATGGGGPLHAYQVARKLGVGRILCPAGAGVASAIGLLRAPAGVTLVRSCLQAFDGIDWPALDRQFAALEQQACLVLERTGTDMAAVQLRRTCDLRYAGQSSETSVAMPAGNYTQAGTHAAALDAFEQAYRSRYAQSPRSAGIELTALQVECVSPTPDWSVRPDAMVPAAAVPRERELFFPECGGYVPARIYQRCELEPGRRYRGPAVVEDPTSTIVAGPQCEFFIADAAHLIITLDKEASHV